MPFYDREKAGVVVSRMTSDVDSLQELVQMGLLQLVASLLLIAGSVVVLAIAPGAPQLLSRNLLYTAVTRARQKLLLVSSRRVIGRMLANVQAQQRYSFLKDYLVHGTGDVSPAGEPVS